VAKYGTGSHQGALLNIFNYLMRMATPAAKPILRRLWDKLLSEGAGLAYLGVLAVWRRVAIMHAGVTPRPAAVVEALMPRDLTVGEVTQLQWADPCHQERVS
jgi:hypothetical protein